jgi:hypothetical protein
MSILSGWLRGLNFDLADPPISIDLVIFPVLAIKNRLTYSAFIAARLVRGYRDLFPVKIPDRFVRAVAASGIQKVNTAGRLAALREKQSH